MRKVMNIGFIIKDGKMLLGMKKRGFGQGKWNGFGGKVKENESMEEALKREMLEEAGITILNCEKKGIIEFQFQEGDLLEVHFYRISEYSGEPMESEEMLPRWFDVNELPFKEMWVDDSYWMPLFLKDKKFTGNILFKDQSTIINCDLKEVDSLS